MNDADHDLLIEIKAMLTVRLQTHDEKLGEVDETLTIHARRLDEKGKLIARHDERIKDLEESSNGRIARITAVIGCIIAVVATAIAVSNFLTIH